MSIQLSIGDHTGARHQGIAILAPAERLRDRFLLAGALWKNAMVHRLTGDWQAARDFGDRGLAVRPNPPLNADLAMLECEVGELDKGQVYLEQVLERMRLSPPDQQPLDHAYPAMLIPLVANITGVDDLLGVAEEAAQNALASPSVNPNVTTRARAGLALLAVQRGDVAAAGEQYAALQSARGIMLWWSISGDRLLGILSQTMGNMDQATAHFEDALAFCRKAGYRPELAWSCCDYADLLMVAARHAVPLRSDPAKAIALLEESLSIATDLGMRPLMERVTERLERIQAQPSTAPAYPGGLTEREVEVLRLVAAGKTNLEIAEDLVIAEGTARRHVANIYKKIGAANRVEAASYASQHNLLEPD